LVHQLCVLPLGACLICAHPGRHLISC